MIDLKITLWDDWKGGTQQPGFFFAYEDGGLRITPDRPIYQAKEPELFALAKAAVDVLRVVAHRSKEAADGQ